MHYYCNNLTTLEKSIQNCSKCKLSQSRQNIVFGEGNTQAKLMLIAEAPGSDEDRIGTPFVGRAGKVINWVLKEVGLTRDEIYISNIVKCHPSNNRNPEEEEMDACIDYLRNQVILIKPKIIILLGSVALKKIIGKEYAITKSRGKWITKKNIKYMPTWHPAAVLRDETKKDSFLNDFKLAKEELEKLDN